jgi:streptomycin 6-kinase
MNEFFVPPLVAHSAAHSGNPDGPAWLRELPARVARLTERWELELELGAPFVPGGMTSYVAPARRADGSAAVLKVVLPHREARDEADALRVWAGDGAVQLLDAAREEHALLLERCVPGTPLGDLEDRDAVLDTGADVLARLWRAPAPEEPFEPLAAVADWFAELVAARQVEFGRPLPDRLVDEALVALRDLPRTASARVVLHHDFHPGNVLAAERQAWLAIDPKPQVGDPAFDPLQLILQTSDPLEDDDPTATIRYRLRRLSERLDVDWERVRAWGVARCVEWALYSYHENDLAGAEDNAAYARIFSEIG